MAKGRGTENLPGLFVLGMDVADMMSYGAHQACAMGLGTAFKGAKYGIIRARGFCVSHIHLRALRYGGQGDRRGRREVWV